MDNNIVTTKSIGAGIEDVSEDFILCKEAMSRLVFHAQIHNKGIRGKIIRQRRESKNDKWEPDKSIDIRTLGKNESINLDFKTEAIRNLYQAIEKLASILRSHGVEYGENNYAVVDPDSVIITDKNKVEYIKKIIDAGYDEEIWHSLIELNPSLATKLSYARIQTERSKIVKELQSRLDSNDFPETAGDDSWQKWIYKNNWLFGVNYKKPIERAKINIAGVIPDYLFPTVDGFVDILEIKKPKDDVIKKDPNHLGSWMWTPETNAAIGQVINYLGEIDRLKLEIEREIKFKDIGCVINLLKPRAFILIGDSRNWKDGKKEGLRKLNHSLHGIEILTYKELLNRGNQFLQS